MEQAGSTDLFDLHIDQPSINFLGEAARWSRFLAIIGFIYCGLMVIFGIFFGTILSLMAPAMGGDPAMSILGSGLFSGIIIIVSLLLFFPAYYLFNFSTKMRKALQNNDQPVLAESLKNLKSFFKFYGIFVIVGISFYALMIIFGIIGAIVGHRS
jgi:Family of unknown function (DUF5362)